MKLAVISESPADEAAIRILVEAILGIKTEVVAEARARAGGWSQVTRQLPALLKHFHYRTDVEAVVAVIDSDDTPIHHVSHEQPEAMEPTCRLCTLQNVAARELARLNPRPFYSPIKLAFGVAVPAIEAWYRCGEDAHNTEAEWARQLKSTPLTVSRNALKVAVYGTDRPSLPSETAYAIKAAQRLTARLNELELLFPGGFGTFAQATREW